MNDLFELIMLYKVIFIYLLFELIYLFFKSVVMSFNYCVKKVVISIISVYSKWLVLSVGNKFYSTFRFW